MKNLIYLLMISLSIASCSETEMSWQLTETIKITGINPIGIAYQNNGLWLSDGDHNRVVKIDEMGNVIQSIDSLDRPMHIAADNSTILIPQYGNDQVMQWSNNSLSNLALSDSLDAPAGVWKHGSEVAIADFYNNRILYSEDGSNWTSFGKEGKAEGEFYYPTDVQITNDHIYVADAYNNRIQVFDKSFNFKQLIGADQHMNAATGIFVSDSYVFTTDFENDRVLIFNLQGDLIQEIDDNIEKPTDLLYNDGKLFVINYRNSLINVFEFKELNHE